MGRTEDGIVPDIRIDALGVLGRLNTGQCIEQELNWIADAVQTKIKATKELDEKFKLLYKYLDLASPKESQALSEYLSTKGDSEREEFISGVEKNGIVTIQSPMYCATTETLSKLCEIFEPLQTNLYFTNEYGEEKPTIRKMIVADEYILRLKQEPITKISVRSKSMVNPRTSMPIKSTKAARHKIIYADQCKYCTFYSEMNNLNHAELRE